MRTLHLTVYDPVRKVSTRVIRRKLAPQIVVVATFLVSDLMHELILFYIGRKIPIGSSYASVFNGVCLAIEFAVKKEVNGKLRQPRIVTMSVVVAAFSLAISVWQFMLVVLKHLERGALSNNRGSSVNSQK
ncbi:long-chain-alcohol O-fatty-acyltransferase-like [Tripterygium wilfordii]|uniref:Long-chain-alcohol O-fatty-acyltransferase-like n=1 Tax=Tripterygium wilfordii TaxID=458696 RepID=A0A7J7E1G1_TRIWF|nr:long-chain-alcohol O-fatty-acyltransferase-like [Tripterygium wilfordii]KAF5752445.1 long-chain-alcohol O-fatty-acyltransferase-like [Tripterygium wilfordii]